MKINTTALELLVASQGMNFSKLAEKSKVSRQTISTIKGRGSCDGSTLLKLATALDVKPIELMEDKQWMAT